MPADMPYERDVDREHAEKHREQRRLDNGRADRRATIKNELRRGAGVLPAERRPPEAPATERISFKVSVGELARLKRTAAELHLSVPALLRAAALTLDRRLEGRL